MHRHAPQVKCSQNSFSDLLENVSMELMRGAELIGRIELNQDNSAIEDKAIPCKADNRMLSGGGGWGHETKDRAWRPLPARLVQTR